MGISGFLGYTGFLIDKCDDEGSLDLGQEDFLKRSRQTLLLQVTELSLAREISFSYSLSIFCFTFIQKVNVFLSCFNYIIKFMAE